MSLSTAFGSNTPGSRRGDYEHIVREIRWKLDAKGFDDVNVFVSGGITSDRMRNVRDDVDGFGIGGYVSNADPIDFTLDIVEVEGPPTAKREKLSGKKQVYRTDDGSHHVGLAQHENPTDDETLLDPLIRDGELVQKFDLDAGTERAVADAKRTEFVP